MLLTPGELADLATNSEDLATFDRLAVLLVSRAVLGHEKPARILADFIESRPGLRRGDAYAVHTIVNK